MLFFLMTEAQQDHTMEKEFNLSEKMERYEEPINRAKIEHIVRQAHMKDYKDNSYYCNGCVERAILETIKECEKDVKEVIRLLKEEINNLNDLSTGEVDSIDLLDFIDKLAGDKLI